MTDTIDELLRLAARKYADPDFLYAARNAIPAIAAMRDENARLRKALSAWDSVSARMDHALGVKHVALAPETEDKP